MRAFYFPENKPELERGLFDFSVHRVLPSVLDSDEVSYPFMLLRSIQNRSQGIFLCCSLSSPANLSNGCSNKQSKERLTRDHFSLIVFSQELMTTKFEMSKME